MVNLNTIEKLRTRKEVEDYFKQLGRKITDEELTALKQSYDKAQESSGTLTMRQLDDVVGGYYCFSWRGKRLLNAPDRVFTQWKYRDKITTLELKDLSPFNIKGLPIVISEFTAYTIDDKGKIKELFDTREDDGKEHSRSDFENATRDFFPIYTFVILDPRCDKPSNFNTGTFKNVKIIALKSHDFSENLPEFLSYHADKISNDFQINLDEVAKFKPMTIESPVYLDPDPCEINSKLPVRGPGPFIPNPLPHLHNPGELKEALTAENKTLKSLCIIRDKNIIYRPSTTDIIDNYYAQRRLIEGPKYSLELRRRAATINLPITNRDYFRYSTRLRTIESAQPKDNPENQVIPFQII